MAKRKFPGGELTIPKRSFVLYYPKPVSVGLTNSQDQEFLKILDKINKIRSEKKLSPIGNSSFYKKLFLKGLGIKNEGGFLNFKDIMDIINNGVFNATMQNLGLELLNRKGGFYKGQLPQFYRGILSKLKEENIDEIRRDYNI